MAIIKSSRGGAVLVAIANSAEVQHTPGLDTKFNVHFSSQIGGYDSSFNTLFEAVLECAKFSCKFDAEEVAEFLKVTGEAA